MIYYVNAAAPRDGNGSKQMPFKHINAAAKIAQPGDVVSVAPGVYREYVNPIHAGREDARIEYRSEKSLGARITGAELLTGWQLYQGTTWVAKVDNGVFGTFNPFKEPVIGDWYFYPKDPATGKILDMHRGAVYMNDQMFYEAFTLEECIEGKVFERSWQPELSIYKWFAEVGEKETTIYANFQDRDPNKECVAINVRTSPSAASWWTRLPPTGRLPLPFRMAWLARTGPRAGSLRTATSPIPVAVVFPLVIIIKPRRVTTTTSPTSM